MRIYDKRGKVEEVNSRELVNSTKEERWTYVYMVLVAIGFWALCWVVLR